MSDQEVLARLRALIGDAAARPEEAYAPDADRGAAGADSAADLQEVGKALAFLARSTQQRPLTEAEARAKLAGRDHPEEVVEAACAKAVESGMLDDWAFARAWVTDRGVTRGYGELRLRRELRRRKVPADLIERAISLLDSRDEEAVALDLARRRAQAMPADLDPTKVTNRLAGMLMRRGFRPELSYRIARRATAVDREWD